MEIIVDQRNRLLHVHLSGFKLRVGLPGSFAVFHWKSGPKPSQTIDLGCLWSIPSGNFANQARWQTNGDVAVVGGGNADDRLIHTPRTLPIPDGVTFG
ncbi:hypothetical protein [Bifidobacterium platyrrhinorum]|uniref:Uncharacterized protein n=1 Tax=Bifidobacterium platyrrhinorum TaxID=2661628 RepID=A0A6L9SWD5_9BIFI|nr:hypothetical protein [Bifidobacterium platyrrhinorum]NEG56123.1 hypothetical protein [Bifidobacterium platyrrhinorum]